MQKKSFYCEIRLFAEKIIERMSCEWKQSFKNSEFDFKLIFL
jgi:hypothetical protein